MTDASPGSPGEPACTPLNNERDPMKRLGSLLLLLVFAFGLSGCWASRSEAEKHARDIRRWSAEWADTDRARLNLLRGAICDLEDVAVAAGAMSDSERSALCTGGGFDPSDEPESPCEFGHCPG